MNRLSNNWKEKLMRFLKDPLFLNRWVLPYYREEEPDRISVRLGSGGYRWVGHNYRGDIFMFVEDMHTGIMPFTHVRREDSQFTAHVEPVDPQVENVITEALDRRGYPRDLADSLSEFVRSATQSLFIYGRAVYEIICKKDPEGNIDLEFVDVYPLSIRKFCGSYYQLIPWWVAKHSHVKVGIRKIPKEKIMYIEFPEELRGRKNLVKILKRLSFLSKELIPEFQMRAMKNSRNIGFDIDLYSRAKYFEKARLTKVFGWNQRKIPDNNILEYYSVLRHLNFALSQAIIKEHILDSINRSLCNPPVGLNAKIVMTGVPSATDIRKEYQLLFSGGLSFTDQFKRTIVN